MVFFFGFLNNAIFVISIFGGNLDTSLAPPHVQSRVVLPSHDCLIAVTPLMVPVLRFLKIIIEFRVILLLFSGGTRWEELRKTKEYVSVHPHFETFVLNHSPHVFVFGEIVGRHIRRIIYVESSRFIEYIYRGWIL